MPRLCQAIFHLKPGRLSAWAGRRLRPALATIPGVSRVQVASIDATISVEFDHDRTGLGDLVRVIEDAGTRVAGVAQRRIG
jgi:copper chaperone CopZ